MLEITGSEAKLDSLLEVLQPYGVLEMARTGTLAMAPRRRRVRRAAGVARARDTAAADSARHRLLGVTRARRRASVRPSTRRLQEFRHVMAVIYYDKDADLAPIRDRKVAIIGYGSQGHAHALNLQGQRRRRARRPARRAAARRPRRRPPACASTSIADAAAEADVIMMLVPDTVQGEIYQHATSSRTSPPARC